MISAHSRFLPGTIITLLTAAISGQLKAAVISMTRSYTDATSGATRLVTFDQFDPSLGTLTAITLSATGASRGSFYVHNLDASEILTLNSSTIRIRATLTGDNAPVARITGNTTQATTSPGLSYDIDPLQLKTFTPAYPLPNQRHDPLFELLSGAATRVRSRLFHGPRNRQLQYRRGLGH